MGAVRKRGPRRLKGLGLSSAAFCYMDGNEQTVAKVRAWLTRDDRLHGAKGFWVALVGSELATKRGSAHGEL